MAEVKGSVSTEPAEAPVTTCGQTSQVCRPHVPAHSLPQDPEQETEPCKAQYSAAFLATSIEVHKAQELQALRAQRGWHEVDFDRFLAHVIDEASHFV